MTIDLLRDTLLWCTLINWGLLGAWFALLVTAHDWVYRLHSRWFQMSPEHFDAMHYAGMAVYKLAVIVFNLVPWIALQLVAGGSTLGA